MAGFFHFQKEILKYLSGRQTDSLARSHSMAREDIKLYFDLLVRV
jgi:hypothetical protein